MPSGLRRRLRTFFQAIGNAVAVSTAQAQGRAIRPIVGSSVGRTSASGAVGAAVSVRKYQPGHYLTVADGSSRRGTYYKTSGSQPNLLTLPGIRGVQIRYKWSQLESSQGTYTFGAVKSNYPDNERTVRAELWRCQQAGSRLILMIEDKTFDGTNPAPTYLQGTDYVRANNGGGYTMVRWNTTVQTRFRALAAALGAAFDLSPYWYAVAIQETALGFSDATRTATGYTDELYRDSLINNLTSMSDSFPTSRVFWYTNFFPSPSQDFRIGEVADAIKTHNSGAHGIDMGGPDILPDRDELVTRVYPRWGDPPVGSFGELKLFQSMQFDSYAHVHTTATPDPRIPGAVWSIGDYWSMAHLFQFARDHLNVNYVMWEHKQGTTGPRFDPDGRAVIAANPTFNVNY